MKSRRQSSPSRLVSRTTSSGRGAKTLMKPMPNLPILVRSSSFEERNFVSRNFSMMARFIPSPQSATWAVATPLLPRAPGVKRSVTSTRVEPASMLFWISSR